MNCSRQNIPACDLPTDQYDERPEGTVIDTLIIHSMYNPDAQDRFSAPSCKACLDKHEVSVHYIIDLDGRVWGIVPEDKKAFHAGVSTMPSDGREGVNDFSIGIELVGTEDTAFNEAQYQALALLTQDIFSRHGIQHIYGHADIARGRKTDPWGLDWPRYRQDVLQLCPAAIDLLP